MALGRGENHGMNQRLIKWISNSDDRPVGIVFMDFATIKRKASGEEEEESDLIHGFIKKQMWQ
jgi:hypothetical protein